MFGEARGGDETEQIQLFSNYSHVEQQQSQCRKKKRGKKTSSQRGLFSLLQPTSSMRITSVRGEKNGHKAWLLTMQLLSKCLTGKASCIPCIFQVWSADSVCACVCVRASARCEHKEPPLPTARRTFSTADSSAAGGICSEEEISPEDDDATASRSLHRPTRSPCAASGSQHFKMQRLSHRSEHQFVSATSSHGVILPWPGETLRKSLVCDGMQLKAPRADGERTSLLCFPTD